MAEEPKPTTKMVTGDADPALDLSMIDYSNYGQIYGVAAPLLLPAIEKTIEGVTITIAPEVAPVIVAGAAIYAGLYFADKYIRDIACQPSYGAPCSTLVNGVPVVYMEQQAKLIQEAFAFSKGGRRNIWPDQYGYPPNVKTVDWSKSDGELADELSKKYDDPDRGQGTPNNYARKWFRDKRPK